MDELLNLFEMDVTLLYNGPHVQRKRMFTLSRIEITIKPVITLSVK